MVRGLVCVTGRIDVAGVVLVLVMVVVVMLLVLVMIGRCTVMTVMVMVAAGRRTGRR